MTWISGDLNNKVIEAVRDGVVEIVQVTLQVVFIEHFREKVRKMELDISDALEQNGRSRMINRFIMAISEWNDFFKITKSRMEHENPLCCTCSK